MTALRFQTRVGGHHTSPASWGGGGGGAAEKQCQQQLLGTLLQPPPPPPPSPVSSAGINCDPESKPPTLPPHPHLPPAGILLTSSTSVSCFLANAGVSSFCSSALFCNCRCQRFESFIASYRSITLSAVCVARQNTGTAENHGNGIC